MTREIHDGAGRPDAHETRTPRVNQSVASEVGSGRVNRPSIVVGRVGSGQEAFKYHGSGQQLL